MSRDLLVLIGDVTPADYQDYRLQVLRKGAKPRVVRVPLDVLCLDEARMLDEPGLFVDSKALARTTGVSAYEIDAEIEDEYDILHGILKEYLQRDPADSIAMVLYSSNQFDEYDPDDSNAAWLTVDKLSRITHVSLDNIHAV